MCQVVSSTSVASHRAKAATSFCGLMNKTVLHRLLMGLCQFSLTPNSLSGANTEVLMFVKQKGCFQNSPLHVHFSVSKHKLAVQWKRGVVLVQG